MEIVLATINAKYIHAAFGLRYLQANLGPWRQRSALMEFTSEEKPVDIVERIVQQAPKIVGLSVYIWNVQHSFEVVALLKRVSPQTCVVIGGPEVSHETDGQPIVGLADYVITGEGEDAFRALCGQLLAGKRPLMKIIAAPPPDVIALELPYELYSPSDIEHRVVYVEASRGCPFACEFCLSALDERVRNFPVEKFLGAMDDLLHRGLQHFKFVDRTFNLSAGVSERILRFFLERYRPGLFVHFELIPDRLPARLREVIKAFPTGALQFEIGIQTFNETVSHTISRRQDVAKLIDNLTFLRRETGVHLHTDLIVGLPGENLESFAVGLNQLVDLGPQEIQIGILKRLRGTPIVRHDREYAMVYSPVPPYEVLSTRDLDFPTLQCMKRFAQIWDTVVNSGNFRDTAPYIWQDTSVFDGFWHFSESVFQKFGRVHAIALDRLAQHLRNFIRDERGVRKSLLDDSLVADYQRCGRKTPSFLPAQQNHTRTKSNNRFAARQARHLG
ncbi:MAG: DUF4080 domain-containing protein [Myxococcota bacterium]